MFIPSESVKRIAFAFPTSTLAKELGFDNDGCFFVEYQSKNEADTIYTWHDTQIGGFTAICSDLLKAFSERKAPICKASTHYNPEYYKS